MAVWGNKERQAVKPVPGRAWPVVSIARCLGLGGLVLSTVAAAAPVADAAAAAPSGTPAGSGAGGQGSLVGQWSGESMAWGQLPSRWIMTRHADGRFDVTFTTYEARGRTSQRKELGGWTFTEGVLRMSTEGVGGPPEAYRVRPEAFGCLRMEALDADTGRLRSPGYEFLECPHPSRWPQQVSFACRVELGQPSMGVETLRIEIDLQPDGRRRARINGEIRNEDVEVIDHPVRSGFVPSVDPFSALNPGEAALQHLAVLAADKELGRGLELPFQWPAVRMVRIYELEPGSRTDKFGGTVLFEPFDSQGRSLGKMVRALLVGWCR